MPTQTSAELDASKSHVTATSVPDGNRENITPVSSKPAVLAFEQPDQFADSTLFLETRAMCEYAMSHGLNVPPLVIQDCEIIRAKIPQGISVEDLGNLAKMHQQLARIVAPASPQTLVLIHSEQKGNSIFSFLSLIPVVRKIIGVSMLFLLAFILLGQLEIVNETNLQAGILGSQGVTALAVLGYLIACAGLGACFTSLYRLREYVSNLTFDPRHNSSYWTSILLGAIAGLFISELLYGFVFATTADAPNSHTAELGKPALALLAGFSSNMVHTMLQRIVDSIESLFKGDQKQVQQVRRNADMGDLKIKENEMYMDISQKLIGLYQNPESDAKTMRTELKTMIDKMLVNK